MDIAGYFASILIGISLGLIGGGGSILTVPVLVYLFSIDAVLATTYSLFIVGSTSIAGSISYFRKGLVHVKAVIVFGIPSVVAVFLTRVYLLPAIPFQILYIDNYLVTKSILLMLLFALLMIVASYSMLKKSSSPMGGASKAKPLNFFLILTQGILTGVITGLIGAGGGFLIIPALVAFVKLPMKNAVGTSLVIISLSSLTGFFTSLSRITVQWPFLLTIVVIAVIGILIGSYLSTKIEGKRLKPTFGWFVLVMGVYIIMKETVLK